MKRRQASRASDAGRTPRRRAAGVLLMIAVGMTVGWYYGFRLTEEKRTRVKKLMFEGREMWFRLFV